MHGVAVTPLTVDFHERGFRSKLNSESKAPFWFQMNGDARQQHGSPMGPANPQALNRYAYVQNNPLKYTDPTGHNPDSSQANGVSYEKVQATKGQVVGENNQEVLVDERGYAYRETVDGSRDYLHKVCIDTTNCKYVWQSDLNFGPFQSAVDAMVNALAGALGGVVTAIILACVAGSVVSIPGCIAAALPTALASVVIAVIAVAIQVYHSTAAARSSFNNMGNLGAPRDPEKKRSTDRHPGSFHRGSYVIILG
jgi:hypothetical protein